MITDQTSRVVVLGGGYAGSHAAAAARRTGAEVTVVDHDGLHGFLPRLAGVAGGRLPARDAQAPLDGLLDVEVVHGRVEAIDSDHDEVILADGSRLGYDAAVITVGSVTAHSPVPGADRYARSLHTPDDALRLRDELATASRLVVVGGGATGVQLAAEAAAVHRTLTVQLIEERSRLLPAEPTPLGRAAQRLLEELGVHVHLGMQVADIDASGAELADGRRLDGLVVWAGGWEAETGHLLPRAETIDGRLVVGADLTVPGHARVLAAGDIAAHHDVLGRPLVMSAQIAVQAGAAAGRNAAAIASGARTRRARLFELGRVVDLGHRGVGRIGPFPLGWGPTARLVPLLHLAIDLRHVSQLAGPRAALAHAPGRHRAHDGRTDGADLAAPTPGR